MKNGYWKQETSVLEMLNVLVLLGVISLETLRHFKVIDYAERMRKR